MIETDNSRNDIEGLLVSPLKQISDDRGKVMHMLRCDSPAFSAFGEIYFSVVNPGIVKAWKRHRKMVQNIAVPVGSVELVLFDDRDGSSTKGQLKALRIGEDDYRLVRIPPMIWYGFRGVSDNPSLIANCPDLPHDPSEMESIDSNDEAIPFSWEAPYQK